MEGEVDHRLHRVMGKESVDGEEVESESGRKRAAI